ALLDRALSLNTQLYGRNSEQTAYTLYSMAGLATLRDDRKAIGLYEETLRIRERTLGPRHVATADALIGLAASHLKWGDAQAAAHPAEQALDIYSHTLDANDERMLTATNVLLAAAFIAGDLRRARSLYEQLLPRIE